MGRHRQAAKARETLTLRRQRAQCPIGDGNDQIDLMGSYELEDRIYKLCRFVGRNGIVKCEAAVARPLCGSKDSPVGAHCDPMPGAPKGTGDGKGRRAVTV